LAVQGAQIEARDVIAAMPKHPKENSEEEWSVIDLKDEKCLMNKENLNSKNRSNQGSAMKQIKGAASVFGFVKTGKSGTDKSIFDSPQPKFPSTLSAENELEHSKENPLCREGRSILMEESGPPETMKVKRKPFGDLFHREQRERDGGGGGGDETDQRGGKSGKKQWGFDGFKKWKRNETEDANCEASQHFARSLGEGPDTKLIKKKLHSDGSPSDFFIDKVLL
jgi:hypothetical protein